MTTTTEGRHTPGRPLWLAAERFRMGQRPVWTKGELAEKIGIGRTTYDRLETSKVPPRVRTIAKIADAIGLDYDTAMHLAGLTVEHSPQHGDSGVDVVVNQDGRRITVQAKHFDRATMERHLNILRQVGGSAGRTLGDVLVMTGLAEDVELAVTETRAVEADDDGPGFTLRLLDSRD